MTKLIKIAFLITILGIVYNNYHIPEETEILKIYRSKMCNDIKYRCYRYFINNNEILYDKSNYPIIYNRMIRLCKNYDNDIINEKIRINKIKLLNLLKVNTLYIMYVIYVIIVCYE